MRKFNDAIEVEKYLDSYLRVYSEIKEPLDEDLLSALRFLKTNGLYEKIYFFFGSKFYRKNTPIKVQAKDIYKMVNEGRYYHIYEKYGHFIYRLLLPYFKEQDLKNEFGKDLINKLAKAEFISIITIILLFVMFIDGSFVWNYNNYINKGIEKYENDDELISTLESYNRSVEDYASYIEALDLETLETIVKVIDDMWSTIKGYSNSVEGFSNELAYNRLALYHLGYGSCRHIADDFATRMNAINPEFEAFNLAVYLEACEELYNNDTKVKIYGVSPDEDVQVAGEQTTNLLQELFTRKNGNHMVTCITVPGTSQKLIVDPTNPSIGVLDHGRIVLLTDVKSKDLKICGATTTGLNLNEKQDLLNYLGTYFSSFFKDYDYSELMSEYGTSTQNEALEYLKSTYSSDEYKIDVYDDYTEEEPPKTLVLGRK